MLLSWELRIGFGINQNAKQWWSIYMSMICFLIRKEQKSKFMIKNEWVLYDGLTWNIQASVRLMIFKTSLFRGGGGIQWSSPRCFMSLNIDFIICFIYIWAHGNTFFSFMLHVYIKIWMVFSNKTTNVYLVSTQFSYMYTVESLESVKFSCNS